jgi:hypothetical protein
MDPVGLISVEESEPFTQQGLETGAANHGWIVGINPLEASCELSNTTIDLTVWVICVG